MATIIIPDSLGKFTNQETRVLLDGSTIKEIINNLNSKFPELKDKILDKNGATNSNVTIFIENENTNPQYYLLNQGSPTSSLDFEIFIG